MKWPKLFLLLSAVCLLCACSSDLQKAEALYQQSQALHLRTTSTLADPLSEAIQLLEGYLARNADEPAATLLLWRCYLQAGHPRAQAMCDNMQRMPEKMRRIFPGEIRRERDEHMRAQMVYRFGKMATEQDTQILIRVLEKDGSTHVQGAAAEVLSQIRAAEAVSPLLRKLAATPPAARLYACRALSSFPQPEAITALVARMLDRQETPEVRQQAAQSLAEICRHEFDGRAALVEQLEKLVRDDSQPLLARLLAASILAAVGHTAGYELAMASAGSSDPFARGVAIITLGYIGDQHALPHLTTALEYGNKALRLQAAEALGRLGNAKALPSLYKALDDPSEAVRTAANQSITKIKAQAKNG
ncbi:MAG: HEAT repeat domain-containing protein [candidate division KSB1 bacterium]|nr:HEAT repeat domain-containing protein [candidate division KSB1 bacterium]MDZ7368251.1 HEAT repeat domain-containing protein [candidate division KSB1 bacterium]MDZ7406767.1 HEAT repeat domain-containing protein [candidate division KSB1 bacterium]